jgi:hypothetical protein
LLHKAGRIDETQEFIDKIEKNIPKSTNEPGFNFAKGIFFQYN